MSLWAQEHQRSVQWAVYHKFGRVYVDFGDDGPSCHMEPESARHLGEQLIRWAKEAATYVPPAPSPGRGGEEK